MSIPNSGAFSGDPLPTLYPMSFFLQTEHTCCPSSCLLPLHLAGASLLYIPQAYYSYLLACLSPLSSLRARSMSIAQHCPSSLPSTEILLEMSWKVRAMGDSSSALTKAMSLDKSFYSVKWGHQTKSSLQTAIPQAHSSPCILFSACWYPHYQKES